MKRVAPTLLLLGLLTACQSNPVTISIPDAQFPLASIPTAGRVIFYAQPLAFDRPPFSAQFVVEGQATYQQTNLSLDVYGSSFRPTGAACVAITDYIVCDPVGAGLTNSKLTPAPVNFSGGATQPFTLQGPVLNQAINQGQIWLGVQITASQLSSDNVLLRQMVGKVAVF